MIILQFWTCREHTEQQAEAAATAARAAWEAKGDNFLAFNRCQLQ